MEIEIFSDELIQYAVQHQMQDLAILPSEGSAAVIFSKSGRREFYRQISLNEAQQLITRFKYLGQMDVSEKRRAQLGAIRYSVAGNAQRIRVSTVGDYQGRESIVLRFLYPLQTQNYFFPRHYQTIQQCVRYRGLYLFAGPTSSGKTTLMYDLALRETGQVIAIEDPVEIEEPSFLQLQTNDKIGQTYDELIRLSLRHRPELLIIGEIRSQATAKAAVRAVLTGHRVFATIHARGVAETRTRLLELLGTNDQLEDCLMGIVYQRLLPDQNHEVHGLFAYQFYDEQQTRLNWHTAKAMVKEWGLVDDNLLELE